MKYKKQILATCILLLAVVFAHGQTTANTSGGEVSGSGGKVSYSVGQIVCQSYSGTNGSVSEGVQQPYEISVVIGIENTFISLEILAYPNPTTDYLKLKVVSGKVEKLSFQLYDLNGKLLQTEKLNGTETQINMSSYTPASYFVRVISEKKSIKEFKIIKK